MSIPDDATAFDRWMAGQWTPSQRAVIVAAEALAECANRRRPWWRRRPLSPMDFVPTAVAVVTALQRQLRDLREAS